MNPAHIINVTGMDPSLRNWGLAHGTYNLKTKKLTIISGTVIQTKRDPRAMTVSHGDLECAKALAIAAFEATRLANVTFVEVPHGSQSARGGMSVGVAIGILAALRANSLPFIHVTATQLKMATIGKVSASKESIINRAAELYPCVEWPYVKHKGVTKLANKCEHIADAIGAIEAGILTNDFEQLLALRR